jgi:hypothetical protein
MKKERLGPDSEPSYDFIVEGDFELEAPVMDKSPRAVFKNTFEKSGRVA